MTAQDLYKIISKVCNVEIEDIQLDSFFLDDFNSDPTQMQELREIIEDNINEKFDNQQYETVQTVNDLITLIEENSHEFIG